MNRTPDFDPDSGVPYHPVSPESGSDGYGTVMDTTRYGVRAYPSQFTAAAAGEFFGSQGSRSESSWVDLRVEPRAHWLETSRAGARATSERGEVDMAGRWAHANGSRLAD